MYNTLLRLYITSKLSDVGLQNAVDKGWITAVRMEEIIASK